MMKTNRQVVFECEGWTVEPLSTDHEDWEWIVYDRDHEEYCAVEDREEACEICHDQGLADAKERLWDQIINEVNTADITLGMAREVARILGVKESK